MSDTVVICDGDVTVLGNVTRCLIIARKKIKIVGHSIAAHLSQGETIKPGLLPRQQRQPLTIPPGADPATVRAILARNRSFWVETTERERHPLGYITFFELSTVGVEVEAQARPSRSLPSWTASPSPMPA